MYRTLDIVAVALIALMTLGPLAMAPGYPSPEEAKAAPMAPNR